MEETSDYEAILRELWGEDHIPNCPNCRRAQPDYWSNLLAGLETVKKLTQQTNERKE